MEKGLVGYRKAALAAPPEKRRGAYREVLLAEQLERMLRSNDAVLEFETLRFQLAKAAGKQSQAELLDKMETLAKAGWRGRKIRSKRRGAIPGSDMSGRKTTSIVPSRSSRRSSFCARRSIGKSRTIGRTAQAGIKT